MRVRARSIAKLATSCLSSGVIATSLPASSVYSREKSPSLFVRTRICPGLRPVGDLVLVRLVLAEDWRQLLGVKIVRVDLGLRVAELLIINH